MQKQKRQNRRNLHLRRTVRVLVGTDYRPFRLCVAGARRQHFTLALSVAERWLRQAQLTPGEAQFAPSRC